MNQKPTILHVITGLGVGGAENALLKTLPLLNDFNHHIISLTNKNELKDRFIELGIPVTTINVSKNLINGIKNLKKVIKEIQPNLIISYLIHANLLIRFLVKIYFRNIKHISSVRSFYKGRKWYYFFIDILTSPLVDHYIVVSPALKRRYEKIISKNKISFIPNGVDTTLFHPTDYNQNKNTIICVARFHKNKGHKELITAFSKIKNQANLILIGDGEEKENIKNLAKKLGVIQKIKFLGEVSNVHYYLQKATIFVLPTHCEGMSNALLEAAATGLPIITTNIPENRDIFDKDSAILVPQKNVNTIKTAIDTIIDNKTLREKLKQKSRHIALKFDLRNTVNNYKKLIKSFI